MATEQPTAAEWREIEQRLRVLYLPVHLDCDGYVVSLELARVGKMELGITVYVNGWFKGKWMVPGREPTAEGRRFYQEKSRYLHSARQRRRAERALGKRRARELGLFARFTCRSPHWNSFISLRRHLVKHNDRIRWITADQAEARRESA